MKTDEKEYISQLRNRLASEHENPAEPMADFFSERVKIYDGIHLGRWHAEYASFADYFRDGVSELLDIGCGTGLELESIFRRFPKARVTGIDISADMLKRLGEKYGGKNIELINADYTAYPFENRRFDAVAQFESLHHFVYDEKQKIYGKIYKALKPGGQYVGCDYIARSEEGERLFLEEYRSRRERDGIPEGVLVHIDIPLTLEHETELIKKAGFKNIEVSDTDADTVIIRAEK